jgi:hypothetical protein
MVGYSYPLLSVFWTMLWFFAFVIYIWLFVVIVMDLFRSKDLGGFAKAAWLIFLIVLPLIGILVYLIARGHTMQERQVAAMQKQDSEFRSYVRDVSASSPADDLAKLDDLHQRGIITDEEFQALKAKTLA